MVYFYYVLSDLLATSIVMCIVVIFFFKQKTAYELRISDWSSDVCSSDLRALFLAIKARRDEFPQLVGDHRKGDHHRREQRDLDLDEKGLEKQIGRASCRERVCQYV